MRLLCWLKGHSVHRKRVRYDGNVYTGNCRHCGRVLVREPHGWVLPLALPKE
ncbi:hypothetical protein [Flavisphingomonas formosensis]|uniref:hypothetical protein n=1 Tax=Flavisphingomonas formosensis TaxID=861534 RepID=UPI0012FC4375|nr:hypothetical protein [Sphingomonas formosensis]